MVLSAEEKRERKRISDKKHYEKNKEKIIAQQKVYYENNKEKIAKTTKEYYENNKERILQQQKIYSEMYNKTPKEIKRQHIKNWKARGVICQDFDSLYCHYLNAEECDFCNITFGEIGDGTNTWRCLDHNHSNGEFRAFLCNGCNMECHN